MLKYEIAYSRRPNSWLLIAVLGLAVHGYLFATYESHDIIIYVSHWYKRVADLGFAAFASPFSNYTPPYLYLLWAASLVFGSASTGSIILITKVIALIGAIWLWYALFRLFGALSCTDAFEKALAALLLPSVILNVSALGQADLFWVAPCVLALWAAMERRFAWVAFWSGVAFAFKAQAIFLAPFVMHLFLRERATWWCWVLPVVVYAVAMLPAWLAGWDWWYLVNVYFRQASWQPDDRIFVSNGGSWWTIFGYFMPEFAIRMFPLGYLIAAAGVAAYLRLPTTTTPKIMLVMATLSALGLPFLLPGMHERFFILGDVLAFCVAMVMRTRSAVAAAMLIQIGSALPVISWAYDIRKLEIVAPFLILGGLLIIIEMLKELFGENSARARSAAVASA